MTQARRNILVVEDDIEIGLILEEALAEEGYEVQVETRGASALVYAAEHAPDLAILDLKLPDVSGYEVCRELRRLSRPWPIPILILTGMARPKDKLRGFASGSDAYLVKPVDLAELVRTVAGLLDRHLAA